MAQKLTFVVCGFAGLAVGGAATAQTLVWKGRWGEFPTWNVGMNWSQQRVPLAFESALIPAGTPPVTLLVEGAAIMNLEVEDAVLLFGGQLYVHGDLHLSGGTVFFSTFFNVAPFSFVSFETSQPGTMQHIRGSGTFLFTEPNHKSSSIRGGLLTIGRDIVLLCESGRADLSGLEVHMFGTVETRDVGTFSVHTAGLANLESGTQVLNGGTWISGGGGIEFEPRGTVIRGIGPDTRVMWNGGRFLAMEYLLHNAGEIHLREGTVLPLSNSLGPTTTNAGLITLGPGATLSTAGGVTQEVWGTLAYRARAERVGTILAQGPLAIDGRLRVEYIEGSVPKGGEALELLRGTSVTGTFAKFEIFPQPPAGPAHIVYRPTSVVVALCYADCDATATLDLFDYLCFTDRFAAGDVYACDCDTSTGPGVCDVFDFICFGNGFAAGCQ